MVEHFASLYLPYPPSINHYYGKQGHRMFLTKKGAEFRTNVMDLVKKQFAKSPSKEKLSMFVMYFPPDKRRRDLDNPRKALQDALMKAGIFEDDSQIYIAREMKSLDKSKVKGGYCYVIIDEIPDEILEMLALVDEQVLSAIQKGDVPSCDL